MSPDKQIIIMDKDKELVNAMTERLKMLSIEALGITNSASFFQVISKANPSLIILSDNLQNPSWSELMGRIKHSSFNTKIPFFLLYSEKTPALEQQSKIYSIKKMFHKPFRFIDFLLSLKEEFKEGSVS